MSRRTFERLRRDKGLRDLIGWVMGGLSALVAALWAAFVYFDQRDPEPASSSAAATAVAQPLPTSTNITADNSVVFGGNVTNSSIQLDDPSGR